MAAENRPESPLLTTELRRHLVGEKEPKNDEEDGKLRYRTRQRVKSIVAEFDRLLERWPEKEVDLAFSDPSESLKDGMRAVVALFYMALGKREFEVLVQDGVYRAEHRMGRTDAHTVLCELTIRRQDPTRDVDALRRKLDNPRMDLTPEEKTFFAEHPDTTEEEILALYGKGD